MEIIFGIFFIGVISAFLFISRGFLQHLQQNRWNDQQPIVSASAQIIGKRTQVSGGGQDIPASTFYFATFETADNERRELPIPGKDYGLLVEGDQGVLTYQGTRYKGFERQRAPQR